MMNSNWIPIQLYCPNCGTKIIGYKNADGKMKKQCHKCGLMIISQLKEKKGRIDFEMPTNN